MNDRNLDELLDAWMEAGPKVAPDHMTDAARIRIPSLRQERPISWLPRRFPLMNRTVMTYALAATAIVAVALLGISLLPGRGTGGPPPAPSAPIPSASIDGVRYDSTEFEVPFSLVVPPGWEVVADAPETFYVHRPSAQNPDAPMVGIDLQIVTNVYADPCDPDAGLLDPPLGATVQDLVDWLRVAVPLHATEPEPVVVGGRQGQAFEENLASQDGCDGEMATWPMTFTGEPYVIYEAEQKWMAVIDVDGRRVFLSIVTGPGLGRLQADGEAVLETLRFR